MVSLCGRGFESLQLHSLYNKEGVSQTYDTPSFMVLVVQIIIPIRRCRKPRLFLRNLLSDR